MRRWNSIIELVYFPLEILYIATLLFGLTSLALGSSFKVLFVLKSTPILLILDMIRAFSVWLIQAFPILFMLRAVYRRHEDGLVVVAGLLGYVAFLFGTAFYVPTNLNPEAYGSAIGIVLPATRLVGTVSLTSLNSGIFGSIIIILITRYMVGNMKRRSPYSLFSFVDKNVSVVFGTIVLSLLSGIAVAFISPYFFTLIQTIASIISANLSNPVNLFVYGIFDRFLSMIGLGTWLHQQFWMGTLGGTWSNAMGAVFQGDIGLWTAQISSSIYGFGAGKLITPYYILNIFAVPAFVLAAYQTYTDRLVRRRLLFFIVIAIIASLFLGSLLPIEIFLLVSAPLLFVFHVVYTGLLFAVLPTFGIVVGYSYSGHVLNANPGTILDALVLIRNPNLQKPLLMLLFVGLMTALAYYAVSTYYYRKGAIGLIVPNERAILLDELLAGLGGLANIKLINASIGKLIIQVNDRDKVDFKKIHHRVSKIVETKAGYAMSYGSSSYMLWTQIKAMQNESEKSA